MTSSRRNRIIELAIIVSVVGGIIVALIARNLIQFTSETTSTSGSTTCQHRLSWVPIGTDATPLSVISLGQQDAWAVGEQDTSAVILHWDGTSWNQIQAHALHANSSLLTSIGAVNAHDIWAVGRVDLRPLILHRLLDLPAA